MDEEIGTGDVLRGCGGCRNGLRGPVPAEFGGAHFNFNLPYDPVRDGTLERIVLSGPGWADTLSPMSVPPMAIVGNSVSDQIRAFFRDWDGTVPAPIDGAPFEPIFSDGIPGGVR